MHARVPQPCWVACRCVCCLVCAKPRMSSARHGFASLFTCTPPSAIPLCGQDFKTQGQVRGRAINRLDGVHIGEPQHQAGRCAGPLARAGCLCS